MSRTRRRLFAMLSAFIAFAIPRAAALAQQVAVVRAARPALVDGVVTDTALSPLAGATISVMGSSIRVVTGENGRFRISALPPGQYIVLASRLRFEPLSERVQLAEADTQRVAFALERNLARLDTVRVSAPQVAARLEEFETRRRNHETTASFNRDDIVKADPADTWQMLSRVSAIRLIPNGKNGGMLAQSTRGMKYDTRTGSAVPCFLAVMIDGVRMGTNPPQMTKGQDGKLVVTSDGVFDVVDLPPPDQIHGIEVFAGAATIPVQYGGAGDNKWCGLIAIWTR